MQSAVAQAQELIEGYVTTLVKIGTEAVNVYDDITGLDFDWLFSPGNPNNDSTTDGDLTQFLAALNQFVTEVQALTGAMSDDAGALASPQSAAGAVMSYFGPILRPIVSAVNSINGFLNSVSGALTQLQSDLAILQQGLDLAKNMSVEFTWKPIISGLEASVGGTPIVASSPSRTRGSTWSIKIDANASNGDPAGLNITIRLDSFAIAFGGSLPPPDENSSSSSAISVAPIACGFTQTLQNADIAWSSTTSRSRCSPGRSPTSTSSSTTSTSAGTSIHRDHQELIPLDAFSDPPFINVTTSGIKAGFSIGIPNIAIGMFSIQNMNISASPDVP